MDSGYRLEDLPGAWMIRTIGENESGKSVPAARLDDDDDDDDLFFNCCYSTLS